MSTSIRPTFMKFATALLLVAAAALPAAAKADTTFVFTPDGGAASTFTLNDSPAFSDPGILFYYTVVGMVSGPTVDFVEFSGLTLEIETSDSNGYKSYDGSANFTVTAVDASGLTDGLDTLTGINGNTGTATLDILPAASATPEPSSLILLGTGLMGIAGVVRRRILNA